MTAKFEKFDLLDLFHEERLGEVAHVFDALIKISGGKLGLSS